MGSDFVDYIVADPIIVPEADQRFYAEKVAYLPNSYQVNDRERTISDKVFTRAQLGLPEEGFVFCSFNNNYKITPAEFDIWMRLLARVEGSVLWLLQDNEWAAGNLRREAAARGVDPARLVFAERAPNAEHLARQRCGDLFLDTFKVNAHTTASDALWAGLPIVTKLGKSFVARVAGSLLHAIGLPELVTETDEAYEDLALELATNPAKLAAVREKLAANRLTTPLFDTERYTRDFEDLLEDMIAANPR
jgi:predicted O-linked N-acetylglucosamine transferase (SPINDLY family)